jgi:hypothetical protein
MRRAAIGVVAVSSLVSLLLGLALSPVPRGSSSVS